MLCFLLAFLGFVTAPNTKIERKRAPAAQQQSVRTWGNLIAVALRVILLFVMIHLSDALSAPFFVINWVGMLEGGVNFATIVFVLGGAFILMSKTKFYSAVAVLVADPVIQSGYRRKLEARAALQKHS